MSSASASSGSPATRSGAARSCSSRKNRIFSRGNQPFDPNDNQEKPFHDSALHLELCGIRRAHWINRLAACSGRRYATNGRRHIATRLSFVDPTRKYVAQIYRDADDAEWQTTPTHYSIESRDMDSKTAFQVRLAPGGGQAIRFKGLERVPRAATDSEPSDSMEIGEETDLSADRANDIPPPYLKMFRHSPDWGQAKFVEKSEL
jgi:hypothetical protein